AKPCTVFTGEQTPETATTTTATTTTTTTTATSTTEVTTTSTTEVTTTSTTEVTTTTTTETVTTTTTTETTKEPVSKIVWGDTDCNGEVNIMDAVLLARAVGDDPTLTDAEFAEENKANSDVEYSGNVDANDLSKLMSYLARMLPYSALGRQ
ncbi:MAG: dockerin type I repeat-containing protein, partial [Oscillospiraceae bacterium]|nr:dockerin type I repeat-containing protein [Oscillospiraceae bacterium]